MAIFSRLFGSKKSPSAQSDLGNDGSRSAGTDRRKQTFDHLTQFTQSRVGVEAYIEPPNIDQPVSILLIATTGEWTRRRVPTARDARRIANDLGIPVYDVNFTGYPQRMRDWNSAHKRR